MNLLKLLRQCSCTSKRVAIMQCMRPYSLLHLMPEPHYALTTFQADLEQQCVIVILSSTRTSTLLALEQNSLCQRCCCLAAHCELLAQVGRNYSFDCQPLLIFLTSFELPAAHNSPALGLVVCLVYLIQLHFECTQLASFWFLHLPYGQPVLSWWMLSLASKPNMSLSRSKCHHISARCSSTIAIVSPNFAVVLFASWFCCTFTCFCSVALVFSLVILDNQFLDLFATKHQQSLATKLNASRILATSSQFGCSVVSEA